tara:strand:+ start:2164 stop:2634 length:471 start_codon:yes stop_codon:yes gene_type:complete
MQELTDIGTIASVIQLAVAPVFLLAGIAGLLNVLSIRLGRAVDRVRVVETRLNREPHPDHASLLQAEISALWSRIRLASWSIRMFVAGALVVCLVIVSLFLSELTRLDMSAVIVTFFLGAMFLLIMGLICFLVEVSISTRSIGHGITEILDEESTS